MNVQDLISLHSVPNKAQLAKKIELGRSTLNDWEENGIPPQMQAVIEILTEGALKADRSALNLRYKALRVNKCQTVNVAA